MPWHQEDWRHLTADAQKAELERYVVRDRARGIALERAPLMRCALFRLGDERYQLLWTHHHIIADGWSGGIIQEDVFALYEQLRAGRTPEPQPTTSYQVLIDHLKRGDDGRSRQYWRRKIQSVSSSPLDLPVPDHTTVDQLDGDTDGDTTASVPTAETWIVNRQLSDQLKGYLRAKRVTLAAVFQGLWSIVLARIAHSDDVLFGVTVSGRPPELAEAQRCVGLFTDTRPVHLSLRRDMPVLELFQQLMAEQAARDEYPHCSLREIKELCGAPASERLFDTLLAVDNFPHMAVGGHSLGGLRFGQENLLEQNDFPLTVIVEGGDNVRMRVHYDARLIHPGIPQQLLRCLDVALRHVVATDSSDKPALTVAQVPLLDPGNVAEHQPSGIRQRFPMGRSLAQRFADVARERGQELALVWPSDEEWP
ncbi:MAG: condensation domain-containing protein, partial [Myxococcota bacterium]